MPGTGIDQEQEGCRTRSKRPRKRHRTHSKLHSGHSRSCKGSTSRRRRRSVEDNGDENREAGAPVSDNAQAKLASRAEGKLKEVDVRNNDSSRPRKEEEEDAPTVAQTEGDGDDVAARFEALLRGRDVLAGRRRGDHGDGSCASGVSDLNDKGATNGAAGAAAASASLGIHGRGSGDNDGSGGPTVPPSSCSPQRRRLHRSSGSGASASAAAFVPLSSCAGRRRSGAGGSSSHGWSGSSGASAAGDDCVAYSDDDEEEDGAEVDPECSWARIGQRVRLLRSMATGAASSTPPPAVAALSSASSSRGRRQRSPRAAVPGERASARAGSRARGQTRRRGVVAASSGVVLRRASTRSHANGVRRDG